MKILLSLYIIFVISFHSSAQRMHIGLTGGVSNYSGDLPDKFYIDNQTKGFFGATFHYELFKQLYLRAGISIGGVTGNDRFSSKPSLQRRNLQFETSISEFSLVGEFYLLNLELEKISPYIFGGLAIFQFDPFTYDVNNRKLFLRPLSTEGQGIIPGTKTYSLLQPAIPFGGGLKIAVSENVRLGLEIGFRKLFTDYLDDVSTTYADYNDLLTARGQEAVDIAYREDEFPGGSPAYPAKGTQRGSSAKKDSYYFTGLSFTYRLGNGQGKSNKVGKSKYGCPSVPQ